MKIEKVHEGVRYTLSNDNLQTNDKVYPIANGRCIGKCDWILHGFSFDIYSTGFPDEPHTIIDLNYSDYKPTQVRTNFGFSPIECYYKIIKMEKQVKESDKPFALKKWVEINELMEVHKS